MSEVKIGIIQMESIPLDVEANYKKVKELIKKCAQGKPDIILIPETWSTGYVLSDKISHVAENEGKKICQEIGDLAYELNVNIVAGSVFNERDGKVYNTAFVFNRKGDCVATYDKIHVFSTLNEGDYVERGSKCTVFELDGVKCGIVNCYDLRQPELTQSLALKGMKILFVPAQWGEVGDGTSIGLLHWKVLNKARAIETQVFLASANGDVNCGNSMLLSPYGEELVNAGCGENIVFGVLDFAVQEEFRNKVQVLKDRRPCAYELV